jgi:hypothetical protein
MCCHAAGSEMAFNRALVLLLLVVLAAAPLVSALITAPLNANTNVRCSRKFGLERGFRHKISC